MSIVIGQPIKSNAVDSTFQPLPNIDEKYGPYPSVAVANSSIPLNTRSIGLTVGIKSGNNIVEYWYNGGTTNAHLTIKNTPNQGGGVEIQVTQNVEDTSTYLDGLYPSASIPTIVIDEVLGGVYIKYAEGSWVKTSGVVLGNTLPSTAPIVGANILAFK